MSRYAFQGTFRDGQGNIVSGGTITVYLAGTDTTATIYEDDTTVTSTSYVESDDNGYFIFYIDSSDYSTSQFFDIQLAKSGYTTKLYPSISIVPLWPTDETIGVTDNTTNNVSASAHGWTPKLSDSASDFLDGKGNWDAVSDADLEVTDVTTNNASTSAHGFLKKLDNEATHFMDGTGAWDTVKDSDLALTDITDNDVSTTKHGFVPKLPDDVAQFLNGTGNWTTVSGGGGGGGSTRQTVLSSSIDSYGKPDFISAGTGLAVDIAATSAPILIAFAAGFGENGTVDYVGTVDADTSISSLTANATNYLYAERNSSTGAITLGKTTTRPEYSSADPKTVTSYPPELSSTYLKATGYYSSMYPHNVYNTAYPLTGGGGDATRAWMNAATTNQRFHFAAGEPIVLKRLYYSNYHNAGANTNRGAKNFILQGSNSISSFNETTYATDTGWTQIATGQFEQHAASDTADLKTINITGNTTPYKYYALKIADNWGDGTNLGFRTVEFQGSGLHWFDTTTMRMYEWNGSEWANKQIVFLGEAITDGSSVTSVVNYALNGKYVGDWTANPGTNVAISKNHNIGTTNVLTDTDLKCLVPEYGYSVGDIVKGSVGGAAGIFPLTFQLSKTAMSIYVANTLYITALRRDTGIGVALTPASWNYRFKARRSF